MLLGSKGKERLIFRELLSRVGLQPAGCGGSCHYGAGLTGEPAALKCACKSREFPPTSSASSGHNREGGFFASLSARQGFSTPPPQAVMWRAEGTEDGPSLDCGPLSQLYGPKRVKPFGTACPRLPVRETQQPGSRAPPPERCA